MRIPRQLKRELAVESRLMILVVEDEPLIGVAVQDALESAGYQVELFSSGNEAIDQLEVETFTPSGLITDIRLRESANGWEVARRARELHPMIPVVYMTGDSAMDHSAQGVPDSVMVQKPFAAVQIVTAIAQLLNALPPTAPQP